MAVDTPATDMFFVAAACAALVTLGTSLVGVWLVRGSTAAPAAWWAAAAAAGVSLEMTCRALGGLTDPAASASARLVTMSLACWPAMALPGAKRPQHVVWQAIVASLAVVLAMPAMSAAIMRPGVPPDIHPLGRGFLALLLAVGWMNFAGTRHGVAAALVTVGQTVLAWPALPFTAAEPARSAMLEAAGCWLVATGAGLAAAQSVLLPARSVAVTKLATRIEAPFLALRETLGAAWAIRIAERFNDLAGERGWPCRLSFGGLDTGGDPADVAWQRDAIRAFHALARRFASTDWLSRHSGPPVNEPAGALAEPPTDEERTDA